MAKSKKCKPDKTMQERLKVRLLAAVTDQGQTIHEIRLAAGLPSISLSRAFGILEDYVDQKWLKHAGGGCTKGTACYCLTASGRELQNQIAMANEGVKGASHA